jgi:hypothetical protein
VPRRGRDSIWIATSEGQLRNPSTREEAAGILRETLLACIDRRCRVVVGWDFPLGFPDGFAARLAVRGPLGVLRAVAAEVHDAPDNHNDRFAAAARLNRRAGADLFWGAPTGRGIPVRRPSLACAEFRLCEVALRRRGLRPHSPWKLYTTGSCGGQALTGLPRLLSLRDDPRLRKVSRIWPQETGFAMPRTRPLVVHAEIWPTAIGFDPSLHPIRDAAQVLSAVRWMRTANAERSVRPPPGTDLRVAAREGWVLAPR